MEKVFFFCSDTTRPLKCHEESGREYHFISKEQFDNMICNRRCYVVSNVAHVYHRTVVFISFHPCHSDMFVSSLISSDLLSSGSSKVISMVQV